MKRLWIVFAMTLAVATLAVPAFALIADEFSASSPDPVYAWPNGGIYLRTASTTDDHLNTWLGNEWSIESAGSDYYAQQNVSGASATSNMFMGVSAAGITATTPLTLDFDYDNDKHQAFAYLLGMNYGEHDLWSYGYRSDAPRLYEPVLLQTFTLPQDVTGALGWQHYHADFTLGTAYDVLVLEFRMGGAEADGLRAVDSISFQSASAPVPEPSTLLVGVSGLAMLVGMAWRRNRR